MWYGYGAIAFGSVRYVFTLTTIIKGDVQTIFVKNNVKITFRGGGQTRNISRILTGHHLRARGRQMTLWGGDGG